MIDLLVDGEKILVGKNELQYWVDFVESDEYSFKIHGWVCIHTIHSWRLETRIDFNGKNYSFSCKANIVLRNDVTGAHGHGKFNYNESGFFIEVPRQNIGPDNYNISFLLKDKKSQEISASFPFLCMNVR